MSPKLIFAAISTAFTIYGAVGKIKAAKAQSQMKSAQLELQMEEARLQGAVKKNAAAVRLQRTYATQVALAGHSGAQMGGSFNAIARADYNAFQQDYRLIGTYVSSARTNLRIGQLAAKSQYKSVKTAAYGEIGQAVMGFGKTAYDAGWDPFGSTAIRSPAGVHGTAASITGSTQHYSATAGGYAGAGGTLRYK